MSKNPYEQRTRSSYCALWGTKTHTLTARAMPAVNRPDVLSLPFQRFPQAGVRHQQQLVRSSMANSLFWGAVGRTVKCSETMPLASEIFVQKFCRIFLLPWERFKNSACWRLPKSSLQILLNREKHQSRATLRTQSSCHAGIVQSRWATLLNLILDLLSR